jgi:16S rRNA (guanine(966)-N(2))-methyltransferase RsmD
MRIIAGKFGGRKLTSPKDYQIRPTSDRVKEAIFSMLADAVMDSRVLDLFAGTGALGLEAISRGASHCVFVDNNRDSLRLVQENIRCLGAENESRLISGDYQVVLNQLKGPFDLIFMDPPYRHHEMEEILNRIQEKSLLALHGHIIIEHNQKDRLPERAGEFLTVKSKRYGSTHITIYQQHRNSELLD